MNTLLEYIRAWGHWIVFLLLEMLSLVLLFRYNAYQGSVWFTKANAVAGKVMEWQSNVSAYTHLSEENQSLTARNVQLEREVAALREHLHQLEYDSTATERAMAAHLQGLKQISAQVVDNSIRLRDNLITINRGKKDGVHSEMGVVCGTGIVGIVSQAGAHYATDIPVLNSHSNISCRLKDSEYFGYLRWDGGNPLRAYIDDIPRHARVHKGETVETSGYSNVFPAGIFVGRVKRILNSDDGLSYKLEIGMSTDFARLREVIVIENVENVKANANEDETRLRRHENKTE